jgi:hypothetical protein
MRAAGFNSRRAARSGRQQGKLEFWGLKPQFSCSSALVLSRFELHCPVHRIFCRGRVGRANFGVVYRKMSPSGGMFFPKRFPDALSRMMSRMPAGTDSCRHPWETSRCKTTSRGPWDAPPEDRIDGGRRLRRFLTVTNCLGAAKFDSRRGPGRGASAN